MAQRNAGMLSGRDGLGAIAAGIRFFVLLQLNRISA